MGQPEYSPLNEDEEQPMQYDHAVRRPSFPSRLSRSRWFYVLDITLALIIGLLLYRRESYEKVQSFDLNSDITGYAPQVDHRLVTFVSEPHFISNHSSLESLRQAREHWKTLVPRKSRTR